MNRLELEYEDALPRRTRYTIYKRVAGPYTPGLLHRMNLCTLAAAIREAQRMTPRGYIATHGARP